LKHRALRRVAYWLGVCGVVMGVGGVVASFIIALGAATIVAKLTLLVVCLLGSAAIFLLFFGLSRYIYLSLDVAQDIESLVALTKERPKS